MFSVYCKLKLFFFLIPVDDYTVGCVSKKNSTCSLKQLNESYDCATISNMTTDPLQCDSSGNVTKL